MATPAERHEAINLVGPAVRVCDEMAPPQRNLSPELINRACHLAALEIGGKVKNSRENSRTQNNRHVPNEGTRLQA
jgi:hypothetical protein